MTTEQDALREPGEGLEGPKHSPTPWNLIGSAQNGTGLASIKDPGWGALATIYGTGNPEGRANAAFIVTSANNHDALVEALRDALESLKRLHDIDGDGAFRVTCIKQAEVALKAVKGA